MSDSQTLVVKLGTSVLTGGSRRLNRAHIVELVRQCAQLHAAGHRIVIVTSGAIAAGREHLGYPELPATIASKQLLAAVGLADLADEKASSLAYGAQRRLEIARALATEPSFLLLDEPAAGMNPQESEDLMGFVRTIRQDFDLTILLIEHDMKVVMGICEHIWVLDYGVTIAEGAPEAIRRDPKVILAYPGEEGGLHA